VRAAFKHANGRKIDGRYVLTDVERGRTVPNWKPRKLGGGLGPGRRVKARKPRKRDTWFRPYLFNYTVLSRKVKAAIEKATLAAITAASTAVSSSIAAVQPDADGMYRVADLAKGGYSDAFDHDRIVALREAALAKAAADEQAAKEAAALLASAAAVDEAPEGEGEGEGAAGQEQPRRSRSRSPVRQSGGAEEGEFDPSDRQRLPDAGRTDGGSDAPVRPVDSDEAALAAVVRVRDDELRPVTLPPEAVAPADGAGAHVVEEGEN
jgi:hypothetical protein